MRSIPLKIVTGIVAASFLAAAPALASGKMRGAKIPYVEISENPSADPAPVETSYLDQASARPEPERFPPGVPVAPKAGLNPEEVR